MKQLIFSLVSFLLFSLAVSAQPNDLMITYDANQGISGLVGANKVYMYSGAVTSGPSGQWEWITGSVNLDDSVGLMTALGNNVWTICIDPAVYYGTALPILAIDIIFRNENGTAFGYDFNGTYTILDMTTPVPISSFGGVTTGNCGVGFDEIENSSLLLANYPNPAQSATTFIYNLPDKAKNANIYVFDAEGRKVKNLGLEPSKRGMQKIMWDCKNNDGADVKSGVYFISLEAEGQILKTNKMMVTRH